MPDVKSPPVGKRGLAAIVGTAAAAGLLFFVPVQEGTVHKTYLDVAKVMTYCTGATEDAIWGKTYTDEECRNQLEKDLESHAEGVAKCLPMEKLTVGQRVAFVDTAYNIGADGFCKSSMASRARVGDVPGSCEALLLYQCIKVKPGEGDKAGPCAAPSNGFNKRSVRGLLLRRERAREICLKGLP